jgi:hypothetical protein
MNCVAWEVFTKGQPPYSNLQPFQAATGVLSGKLKLQVPPQSPTQFAPTLERCWAFNAQDRPTFQELFDVLTECADN